jgi:hypothetical protein
MFILIVRNLQVSEEKTRFPCNVHSDEDNQVIQDAAFEYYIKVNSFVILYHKKKKFISLTIES